MRGLKGCLGGLAARWEIIAGGRGQLDLQTVAEQAVTEGVHAVRQRQGLRVVGDEQHWQVALVAEVAQQPERLSAPLGVEVASRLVG